MKHQFQVFNVSSREMNHARMNFYRSRLKTMILLLWLLGLYRWTLGLEEVPNAETKYDFIAIIVESPTKFHCTGSLISSRTIFTTCDCIGGFTTDSQLKPIFRPIQTYRHYVVLGVKNFLEAMDKRREIKLYTIEAVVQYKGCTFQRKLGYINNLGALKLFDEVLLPPAPGPVALNKHQLESYVLDRVYNEEKCIVLGYGSINKTRPAEHFLLRIMDVRFLTFMKCKGRICPIKDCPCLLNIDIANNQEMCATVSTESVNCFADRGSPLICQGHLMGIVKYVQCNNPSPLQITRMDDALPYYLHLINRSNLLDSPRVLIILLLTIRMRTAE